MHDLAVEKIGDGGEADVGMRSHVDALTDEEFGRAHLVEKDEGADHLFAGSGERTANFEAAEVARAGNDHLLDQIAGFGVTWFGIGVGEPTHGLILPVRRSK